MIHNFAVYALMIRKFGTYMEINLFYKMVPKKFVTLTLSLSRNYDVITRICTDAMAYILDNCNS